MTKIDSNIIINAKSHVPIEIKQQALDWMQIVLTNLPFIITAFIFIGSALVTYCISRKSISVQQKQAFLDRNAEHEYKISDYRHEWLNNVRDTASEMISALNKQLGNKQLDTHEFR